MTQPPALRSWMHLNWPITLLAVAACHGSSDDDFSTGGVGPGAAGQGRYASYLDVDQSGTVNAGDVLLMRFNQALALGQDADLAFQLPVDEDEFGAGAEVTLEADPSVVRITLGNGSRLRSRGFHDGIFDINTPSGLRISPNAPAGAVVSAANQLDAMRGGNAVDLAPGFTAGSSGESATHVLSHDMDCDGLADLIWISEGEYAGIRVDLQQSTGGFVPAEAIALDGILGMRAADMNHDGRPDLAVIVDDNSVRILFNYGLPGDVSLQFQAYLGTAGMGQPQAVEITDIDGDGQQDVIIGTDLHMLRFLGLGNGGFNDPDILAGMDRHYVCVDSADFDRDGRMDLVVCSTTGDLVWYFGDSGFPSHSILSGLTQQSHAVAIGDVDSDGRLDLAFATDAELQLWRQDGAEGFLPNDHQALLGSNATRDLQLADVDEDSKLDLVLLHQEGLELRTGDGLGSFSRAPQRSLLSHPSGRGLALADFDRDGDLDVFCAAEEQQLWFGSAAGTFGTTTYEEVAQGTPSADQFPGLGATYHIVHADFDGDGDLDAATAHNGGVRLWRNIGAGSMELLQVLDTELDRVQKLAFADFNLDGKLDLVAAAVGTSNHLWLADSAGMYSNPSLSLLPGVQGISLAAGDIDNDGDVDLVIGTVRSQSDRVLLNGGLITELESSGGGDIIWAGFDGELSFFNDRQSNHIALGDMDCDGDLDMVIAQGHIGPSTVWRNDWSEGALDFIELLNLPISADQTATVQLGDMDRDGHVDILFGHSNGATIHFGASLLADGEFTLTHVFEQGSVTYTDLRDVNNDNILDVMIASSAAASIHLHLGSAFGFGQTPDQILPANGVRSMGLGDRDGDGDADLYIGRFQLNEANGLYINR